MNPACIGVAVLEGEALLHLCRRYSAAAVNGAFAAWLCAVLWQSLSFTEDQMLEAQQLRLFPNTQGERVSLQTLKSTAARISTAFVDNFEASSFGERGAGFFRALDFDLRPTPEAPTLSQQRVDDQLNADDSSIEEAFASLVLPPPSNADGSSSSSSNRAFSRNGEQRVFELLCTGEHDAIPQALRTAGMQWEWINAEDETGCPFDICGRAGDATFFVEVKTTAAERDAVYFTANELTYATSHEGHYFVANLVLGANSKIRFVEPPLRSGGSLLLQIPRQQHPLHPLQV